MVAGPVFQHKPGACARCGHPIEDLNSTHVCKACGRPQPAPERALAPDYFAFFGIKRRLGLNLADLDKRFYEVSWTLHPDRFTTAAPEDRLASVERMTFLNEGYRTLKDPFARRRYFLELAGISRSGRAVPSALAELWFEVQESMSEHAETAAARFASFEELFANTCRDHARDVEALEREIDSALEKAEAARLTHSGDVLPLTELLRQLSEWIQVETYLRSLARDVQRLKAEGPQCR